MTTDSEMRAAWYTQLGGPDVLAVGEQPVPAPGPGQVRVRLHTSGVNPSDVKARQRGRGGGMPFPLIIPHSDGAGVVDAVGEGVDDASVGRRVWVMNGQWKRPFGTAAQYVCIDEEYVVDLGDGVDDVVAACFGIPFVTAYHALMADGPIDGGTVLVVGGAGAVGHPAVQIAQANGARVLTTISTPEKAAHATDAGADACINYRTEDVVARVAELTDGAGVDRIVELNFAANAPAYAGLLAPGGTGVIVGTSEPTAVVPAQALIPHGATLHWFIVYDLPRAARDRAVTELQRLLAADSLRTTIAATFPLDEIPGAHTMVERADHIGNVVLTIP